MSSFDIKILSLSKLIVDYSKFMGWDVVSIRDIGKSRSEEVEQIKVGGYRFLDAISPHAFRDMLVLSFDDVWLQNQEGVLPSSIQVAGTMAWSEGKDRIVVHCGAGISRSSAMAYVIACSRIGVDEAIKKLDFRIHAPNPCIVWMGATLLNDERVYTECKRMEDETARYWTRE